MTKMTDLAEQERPREKLRRIGPEYLTDVELLAILLRTGRKGQSVMEMARIVYDEILERRIDRTGMVHWRDWMDVSGIGADKASTLAAAIELGRRIEERKILRDDRIRMNTPETVSAYFMPRLGHLNHEEVHICFLSMKNHLIRTWNVSRGGMDASIVDVRLLMKEALRWDAVGMILVHNHPSGSPEPSTEDIELTKRIAKAGEVMDIHLLDHIIIGDGKFISMKREDLF